MSDSAPTPPAGWRKQARRAIRAAEMARSLVIASRPWAALREARLPAAEPAPKVRAALVAHVFYPDLWPEIVAAWRALPAGSPLIATAPQAQAHALRGLAAGDPLIEIVEVANRGRDIAPFLTLLGSGRLDGFDAVLKLHSKRSPHLRDGDLRRRMFFAQLAGGPRHVAAILRQFENPRVGMVGPGFYFRSKPFYWMANRARIEGLCARMEPPAAPRLGFFEGTMFWIRPAALAPLRAIGLAVEDFEAEAGQIDGTLHHAVERVFALSAAAAGRETRGLDGRVLLSPP